MFDEYQLLDDDIGAKPGFGFDNFFYDADSYGDTQAFLLCMGLNVVTTEANWFTWTAASLPSNWTQMPNHPYGFDVCKDLGIDSDKFCSLSCSFWGCARVPNCIEPTGTVVEAIVNASLKPQSFMNRPGSEQMYKFYRKNNELGFTFTSLHGGLLMPRLEPDVLLELAKLGMSVNHLAHGKSNISS